MPKRHIQLSHWTVGALAGVAVLSLGAVLIMALGDDDRAPSSLPVVIADAAPTTYTLVSPGPPPPPALDAAPIAEPAVADAAVADGAVADAEVTLDAIVPARARDAGVPPDARVKRPEPVAALPPGPTPVGAKAIAIPDPSAFDPVRFYGRARAAAVEMSGGPSVRPYGLTFRGFDRAGKIDLTAGGWVEYTFASADRVKAGDEDCLFVIRLEDGVAMIFPGRGTCVGGVMMPYCALAELWDKAAAARSDNPDVPFPADAKRANVFRSGRQGWQFTVEGSKFGAYVSDDCEKSAAN